MRHITLKTQIQIHSNRLYEQHILMNVRLSFEIENEGRWNLVVLQLLLIILVIQERNITFISHIYSWFPHSSSIDSYINIYISSSWAISYIRWVCLSTFPRRKLRLHQLCLSQCRSWHLVWLQSAKVYTQRLKDVEIMPLTTTNMLIN